MNILKKHFLRFFGCEVEKVNYNERQYQDIWSNIAKDFDVALNKLREKYENRN